MVTSLPEIRQPEAMKIAGMFMSLPESRLHYIGQLQQPDQWTLESREQLPMHKIAADDGTAHFGTIGQTDADGILACWIDDVIGG